MSVFGLPWQFNWVARYGQVALSPRERDRLRALRLWWRRRFDPTDLTSLKERSRRPRRVRAPRWSLKLLTEVQQWRKTYPRWGKDKLVILLRAQGHPTSASTVGRILTSLKKHGRLVELKRRPVGAAKRGPRHPYAMRKPKAYHPRRPGDLVQLDTLDLRPLPGVILKQFASSRLSEVEADRIGPSMERY